MTRDEHNGFGDWGGYFEAKKSKLEEQFAAASDPFRKSNIFAGISIFVNGRTDPSADELKRIMMVHGGTFHHYERSHTNFIIASNLPDVKVRKMDTSKIISAQWVVDCVAQERVIDYKPYLLYTNQKTTQPRLDFGKGKNNSTVTDDTKVVDNELCGILKELQQVVATSPKKNTSSVSNVSTTTTTNTSSSRAMTAVDPAFLGEFYKNSRLHHIATLGAGFKQYVCELRQAHGNKSFDKLAQLRSYLSTGPKRLLPLTAKRYIMHIDMDCFFVSVGLVNHPELRGLPVAVTHSKGGSAATDVPVHPQANRQVEQELFAQRFEQRLHDNILVDKVRGGFDKKMSLSEIASCSYEARQKGIRNGMFVGQALKLCPELKTIPYDFDRYREVAFALYNTVAGYTLNIEAVSCDEMFVDLTDIVKELQVDVMTFVRHLRMEVFDITACPCSAGVAENKLMARMATKIAKPNGQHILESDNAAKYMEPLEINVLPGVGSSMTHKLNQAGMMTCGDVQQASLTRLEMLLGKKMAQTLHHNCRGIDPRPLVYEQQRKSVSAEVNYGIRFTKAQELETFLQQLSAEVHNRLTEIKRKAKSITLKLMVRAAEAPVETSKFMGHGVCDVQNRSLMLKQSTDDVNVITSHVLKLMKESEYPPHELRGIGIHLSKLDDVVEPKKENVIKNMFGKMAEKQKGQPAKAAPPVKEPPVETKSNPEKGNVLYMLMKAGADKQAKAKRESDLFSKNAATKQASGFQPVPSGEFVISVKNDLFGKAIGEKITPSSVCQFDEEVLAQLPEDIRCEILTFPQEHLAISETNKERKRCHSRSPLRSPPPKRLEDSPLNESDLQPSTSKKALEKQMKRASRTDQIVVDYVKEMPQYMHPAILKHLQETKAVPEVPPVAKAAPPPTPLQEHSNAENLGMDPDFRAMLVTWVKTEEVPKPADVDLMYASICYLIEGKKIDEVYEVMKFLCRLIKSKRAGNCRWHMAYNEIEAGVQEKFRTKFDCRLYFTEVIGCCKCC